jgi:hypothetical protein
MPVRKRLFLKYEQEFSSFSGFILAYHSILVENHGRADQ